MSKRRPKRFGLADGDKLFEKTRFDPDDLFLQKLVDYMKWHDVERLGYGSKAELKERTDKNFGAMTTDEIIGVGAFRFDLFFKERDTYQPKRDLVQRIVKYGVDRGAIEKRNYTENDDFYMVRLPV